MSWVRRAVAPSLLVLLPLFLVALLSAQMVVPAAAHAAPAQAVPAQMASGGTPPTAPAEGAGLLPGLDARLVGVLLEYGPSSGDVQALRTPRPRSPR